MPLSLIASSIPPRHGFTLSANVCIYALMTTKAGSPQTFKTLVYALITAFNW
nr:MAG TPA: hypothetical protein [Bacteriophage sp.]